MRTIDRLQKRIPRLLDRARALAEREERARARVQQLRERGGGLGHARRLRRAEARLERVAAERHQTVTTGFAGLLRDLQEQSRRTRSELDRAMSPVVAVAVEWGQIERTFELLDEAAGAPELAGLVSACRGRLEVPAFPVRETEGYVVPFPRDAFVF